MGHGYTTAFWWATGIFAVGLLVALIVFPASARPVPQPREPSVQTH